MPWREKLVLRRFQRVTVSLSLTASDLDVLRYANLIARLGISLEFHFVHVLSRRAADSSEHGEASRRMSHLIAARFEPYPDDLQVVETVRSGDRLAQLLESVQERESRLVLVAGQESLVGSSSLAAGLAQSGACSVWSVPGSSKGRVARILTLIDFSGNSHESLSLAAGLARLSDLEECLALHVGERSPFHRGVGEKLPESGLAAFNDFMKTVNTYGQTIIPLIEQDSDLPRAVVESIRRQGADLVVIGPSSNGRFDEVASRILVESPVPVLLVQPEGAARLIEPMSRV